VSLSLSLYLYIVPSILSTVLQKEKALVTPQLPKLESFSSLLFRFAFSESKRWESEQKSQIFERENREAWWVLLFFFFFSWRETWVRKMMGWGWGWVWD